ncbi:MAG: Ser-Thr-rich GPI-anchored membrane family protein [Candidatus Sumerlaeota bacterium]
MIQFTSLSLAAVLLCATPLFATKPAVPIEAEFEFTGAQDDGALKFEWDATALSNIEGGSLLFTVSQGEDEPETSVKPAARERVFSGRATESVPFSFVPESPGRYRISAGASGVVGKREWAKNSVVFVNVNEAGEATAYVPPVGTALDFGNRDGGITKISDEAAPSARARATSFNVSGTIYFTDRTYTTGAFTGTAQLPVKKIRIEIRDEETVGSELVATALTDNNGYFSVTVPNNDDGNFTGRDLFFRTVAETSVARIEDGQQYVYYIDTPTKQNWGGGNCNFGAQVIPLTASGPFNIWDSVQRGYNYCIARGDSIPPKIKVNWAKNNKPAIGSTYYRNDEKRIYLLGGPDDADEFDDDVITHEYGHVAMYHYSLTKAMYQVHDWKDKTNLALAWSEGWANFFSCAARNSRNFVDHEGAVSTYHNVETLNTDLTVSQKAEDVEGAVAGALFDIFDAPIDSADNMSDGSARIWQIFTTDFTPSKETRFKDFYEAWKYRGNSNADKLDLIMKDFGMPFAGANVTFPTASNTVLQRGKQYAIKWSGFTSSSVDIKLFNGNSLVSTLAASTANDGTFDWLVPQSTPLSNDLRIRMTALPTAFQYDWSDTAFKVTIPLVPIVVNGATLNGSIANFTDEDWYSFNVATKTKYTIQAFSGTLHNSYMVIYGPNSQGTYLEENVGDGLGVMPKIVRTLNPGTYYVSMQAIFDDEFGTYTIRVRK